jgi:hypothetical protein
MVSYHKDYNFYQHPCKNLKFRAYKYDDVWNFEVMSDTFDAQYPHSHKLFPGRKLYTMAVTMKTVLKLNIFIIYKEYEIRA